MSYINERVRPSEIHNYVTGKYFRHLRELSGCDYLDIIRILKYTEVSTKDLLRFYLKYSKMPTEKECDDIIKIGFNNFYNFIDPN